MTASKHSQVLLRELLTPVVRPVRLADDDFYRSLGVKWYAKGLFIKESKKGCEIKATRLFLVEDGDFIYNRLFAWKGSFALAEPDHAGRVVSAEFPTFRVNTERLLPAYLMAFFSSPRLWDMIAGQSSGTAEVSRLRFKEVEFLRLAIPLPPLAEQERTVRLLGEADELRKLRAKADSCTTAFNSALFHEMFGDVRRFGRNSVLGELVQEFRYGTSNKSTGEGKPTLRIPNVLEQKVNLEDLKFVPVSDAEFRRLQLKNGDLLFVRTNGNADNVGRCAIFDAQAIDSAGYTASEFIYASYLIRARLQTDKILPIFVQHFLTSPEGRRALRARAKTSAGQFNINTEGLGSIPIPVPPLALQKEFAVRTTEIRAVQVQQSESSLRLEALFRSLLHRAFQGEL